MNPTTNQTEAIPQASNNKAIAIEILRQLGGNKFIAMTGAKNFWCDNYTMGFKLPGTMTKNRINHIKITLNAMDTYDIEFISIRGGIMKTVERAAGIYNDMLQNIVADRTGLVLSL